MFWKKEAPLYKVTARKAFSAGTVAITQRRKSRHRNTEKGTVYDTG